MKNKLLAVGKRFQAKYFLINGNHFYGQVLEIPDTSRVSNFLSARRFLRVKPDSIVKPGDVAIINGQKFIIGEHGTGFYVDPIYKHFKMFEVDMELNWYAKEITVHPVTGVKQFNRTLFNGKVYISSQTKSDIEDALQIQSEQKIFVCNKPVAVDDILGEFIDGDLAFDDFDLNDFDTGKFVNSYVVTKSDKVLGIHLIEAKKQ
jgi:hypothetical protein